MVMDAQPSPQSVGREFVRQYYTLLNRAPNHLFRFYNNHSIFFHDGLDSHNRDTQQTVVVGQKNIHNRIQQLNFRDVHAKISQVDAQATLGNGVVVQVTGELSNDGQPMRRFTQTFVLAPQSPKNYYVHNDIFRYQDIYSDDENDGESRSENDDEQDVSLEPKITDGSQQPSAMGQPQLYYAIPPPTAAHPTAGVGQAVPLAAQYPGQQQPPAQVNGVVHDELLQVAGIPQPSQTSQPVAVATVTVDPSAVQIPLMIPAAATVTGVAVVQPAVPLASLPTASPINAVTPSPLEPIVSKENILSTQSSSSVLHHPSTSPDLSLTDSLKQDVDIKDDYKSMDHSDKADLGKMSQNEPKTYANLFKSMSSGGGFHSMPPMNNPYSSQGSNKPLDQRPDNMQSMPQRSSSQRQMKDFPERRTSNTNPQFGDSHQLFLGNVPHHATEEELKALFSKFGTVVDLRIHSKPVSKVSGVRLPPNYGFITYEDPDSVQNCLANCPLYFPDNSPDGQKLNVEEKKTRPRNSNDMPPRLSGNMSGSSMGGSSQRPQGGPNRSLSNSGGMMRGSSGGSGGGGPGLRGPPGGPRPSGGFTRNDRSGPGGPPNRGGNNPGGNGNGINQSTGNTYGRR